MRFVIPSLVLAVAFSIGCEKPMDESMPTPAAPGGSSGTSDAAPDAPAAPAAETPAAPAAEAAAPADKAAPAEAKEGDAPKAEEAKAADAPPKESGAAVLSDSSIKLVASKTLKVPTMNCPHGCWPTVKETLAKQPGVASVELAKQANETEISNPQVTLKLNGKFDLNAAITALAAAGFENAVEVN